MKIATGLLMALIGAAISPAALAWGREGHRATGQIAEQLLTPRAKVAVADLLGGVPDLATAATWMDEERPALARKYPGSPQWHYDDIEVCSNEPHECKDGNCASERIKVSMAILADASQSKEDRTEALKMIVHMVGDIQQPLHASDNHDKGGNSVKFGEKNWDNLHSAWDTQLVRTDMRGRNEGEYVAELMEQGKDRIALYQANDVATWLKENNALGRERVYGALPHFTCEAPYTMINNLTGLPAPYIQQALPVIRMQLVKAGARIAVMLNRALDPASEQKSAAKP
ncbi:S1/P1 nuclease [Burkholderiaceae bacterium DAT-1]|nr:S1/P1 nuclease [Burkholderiaceae bacterium DAT-1]